MLAYCHMVCWQYWLAWTKEIMGEKRGGGEGEVEGGGGGGQGERRKQRKRKRKRRKQKRKWLCIMYEEV
ncbi:hypothetical protein BHE74_00051326 [Ensete ventricosum]|nr:hypothetical protein BHE74_00051326 [Ensete ventricosum]